MSSLTKRIITAIVLVGALGSAVILLPAGISRYVLGAFVLVGVWEWSGFFAAGQTVVRVLYTLLMFVAGLLPVVAETSIVAGSFVIPAAVVWWVFVLCWLVFTSVPVSRWACALAGILCLQPAWLALLRLMDGGELMLLAVFVLIVAAADIGAYFAGRAFGQRKLAPNVSPGKTWEGLAGGLTCAAVAAAIAAGVLQLSVLFLASIGITVAAVSVVGDLAVSAFKRHAGLKDSGSLLPGHGGVMDRIDGMIAGLPVYVVALDLAGTLQA